MAAESHRYLNDEHRNLVLLFRVIAMAILQLALIGTAVHGTFGEYPDWSTDEKHAYIAVLFALILSIIVCFL